MFAAIRRCAAICTPIRLKFYCQLEPIASGDDDDGFVVGLFHLTWEAKKQEIATHSSRYTSTFPGRLHYDPWSRVERRTNQELQPAGYASESVGVCVCLGGNSD